MAKAKTNPELDQLLKETVVVQAVDDGDGLTLKSSRDTLRSSYEPSVPFEHWAVGDAPHTPRISTQKNRLNEMTKRVTHRAQEYSNDVKGKIQDAKTLVRGKAEVVDQKVRANPYAFALGAVGVGFILGRVFMGRKKAEALKPDLMSFRDQGFQHTGVHIRRESRYS